MKKRDTANLLNRAAAALEARPIDLTPQERAELIEDLLTAAKQLGDDR